MERTLRDWRAVVVFVGPAALLYTIILLIPMVWSFGYTFFKGSPIGGFTFVGVDNYLRLISDAKFLKSLWFSTQYAIVVSAGQIFFGLLLALLYVFYLKRASALVRTLVFFPVVLPTVAVAQMFVKIFEIAPQYGQVNALLDLVQLDTFIQPWLGQGRTAFWVIVIMDIWRAVGFYGILLYAGLVEISDEVIEAARLDGARGWNLLQFILLPLLTPVIISSLIFSLNGTLKVFDSVLALTGGGPGATTMPLTLYMYRTSFSLNNYGYGSTLAVMLTLECLLVTLLIFRKARRDVL